MMSRFKEAVAAHLCGRVSAGGFCLTGASVLTSLFVAEASGGPPVPFTKVGSWVRSGAWSSLAAYMDGARDGEVES